MRFELYFCIKTDLIFNLNKKIHNFIYNSPGKEQFVEFIKIQLLLCKNQFKFYKFIKIFNQTLNIAFLN